MCVKHNFKYRFEVVLCFDQWIKKIASGGESISSWRDIISSGHTLRFPDEILFRPDEIYFYSLIKTRTFTSIYFWSNLIIPTHSGRNLGVTMPFWPFSWSYLQSFQIAKLPLLQFLNIHNSYIRSISLSFLVTHLWPSRLLGSRIWSSHKENLLPRFPILRQPVQIFRCLTSPDLDFIRPCSRPFHAPAPIHWAPLDHLSESCWVVHWPNHRILLLFTSASRCFWGPSDSVISWTPHLNHCNCVPYNLLNFSIPRIHPGVPKMTRGLCSKRTLSQIPPSKSSPILLLFLINFCFFDVY